MLKHGFDRRSFLKTMSSTGMLAAMPDAALALESGSGHIAHEIAEPQQDAETKPKYSIKFSVCGMSHDHIYGMIGAVQRGGGNTRLRLGRRRGQTRHLQQALPRRQNRRHAGRDHQRSLHPARPQLADRKRARRALASAP